MKKLIALLLLMCLLPLCGLAEMDDEGNLVVELDGARFFFTPIEGHCLTRESSASAFNNLGLSQRELLPWMEANDVYVMMFDTALTCEVYVYAYPTEAEDYKDLTDYGETVECEYYRSYLSEYGYDVAAVEMYCVPGGHKFVWTDAAYTTEDGSVRHMSEYFTVHGGYCVTIAVFPAEGEVTEEQLALGDGIADSMWIMEDAVVLDITGL